MYILSTYYHNEKTSISQFLCSIFSYTFDEEDFTYNFGTFKLEELPVDMMQAIPMALEGNSFPLYRYKLLFAMYDHDEKKFHGFCEHIIFPLSFAVYCHEVNVALSNLCYFIFGLYCHYADF